jgi:hypothetical protein
VECGEPVMSKVSVMYPNPPGARLDHAYYRDSPSVRTAKCRASSKDEAANG